MNSRKRTQDGSRELRHGVHLGRERVNDLLNVLGEVGTRVPLGSQVLDLLESGDFSSEQQPEESFRSRLRGTRDLRKELLALSNGVATVADSLLSIQERGFGNQALDVSHASVGLQTVNITVFAAVLQTYLVYSHLVDDLVSMFGTNSLHFSDLLWDDSTEVVLKSLRPLEVEVRWQNIQKDARSCSAHDEYPRT